MTETATFNDISLRPANMCRADWIAAALESLLEGGVEQVKITRLAERLGVTRGSFYWHFKDRADVLQGLLEVWQSGNTKAHLDAVTSAATPHEGVLNLFVCWVDTEIYNPKLDMAIRAWGQSDPAILQQVRKADRERLEAIADMFERGEKTRQQAVVSARNIYYMQMGYYALDVGETLSERLAYLGEYYESHVGQPLAAHDKAAFFERIAPVLARIEGEEAARQGSLHR